MPKETTAPAETSEPQVSDLPFEPVLYRLPLAPDLSGKDTTDQYDTLAGAVLLESVVSILAVRHGDKPQIVIAGPEIHMKRLEAWAEMIPLKGTGDVLGDIAASAYSRRARIASHKVRWVVDNALAGNSNGTDTIRVFLLANAGPRGLTSLHGHDVETSGVVEILVPSA